MNYKKVAALILIPIIAFGATVTAVSIIRSLTKIVTVQEYTLTLDVDPETCFVGDVVTFSGILSLDGTPIEGETVTLFFSNDTTTGLTDVTAVDGSYQITWTAPYKDTFSFYTQTTIT